MKPRVFIGSSTEALDIAYMIQESLEYDALTTVWTQGIFELTSNTLEDLLKALQNFDFGIFVFKPNDITQIRDSRVNTVRDNVVFEFGLFIGRLGKDKVFFVLPSGIADFHLPTDLMGVMPGKYDNKREDGNLKAALGPFCNQVRSKLQNFVFENLYDLANENIEVKRLAREKPSYWEFLLSAELLKSRLAEINRSYAELEKGLVFTKAKRLSLKEFSDWLFTSMTDFKRIISIFKIAFEQELIKSYGEPGVSGNVIEIKAAVDKIASICKELLGWEYELQGIVPPLEVSNITELMKGWTKIFIDEINRFPSVIEQAFAPENIEKEGPINLNLSFDAPPNVDKILEILEEAIERQRLS